MIATPSARAPRRRPNVRRTATRLAAVLALLGAIALTTACTGVTYYGQAVRGHTELWFAREPIDAVLADPQTSATERRKLALVQDARRFAVDHLALPDSGSYQHYVRLDRDYVVWNVFAAPEFSLEPEQSCFFIVGCLAYRGYYRESAANAHAEELRAAGLDVFVGGVAAYSTLGWFDDPVLSSMLAWSDERLVEILFHEMTHQRIYVRDDTTFNESLAVAVARRGVHAWLNARGAGREAYDRERAREAALLTLIKQTRDMLARRYATGGAPATLRSEKTRAFAALQDDYAALRESWEGDRRFDAWMAQPWNNARLSSLSTYHALEAQFSALLAHYGDDFERAFEVIEAIAAHDAATRRACLARLAGLAGTADAPGGPAPETCGVAEPFTASKH